MRRLLAVLLVLLLASPASATTLYMSGFEMGFPRVNSGDEEDVFALGGTFNQAIVHTGAWSLKQVATATFLTVALNTPTTRRRDCTSTPRR